MGGSFETAPGHPDERLRPLRVAVLRAAVYREARDLVADLPGWRLMRADEEGLVLVCERRGGFLAGHSTVTLRFEGPEEIPSTVVHARSETAGGLPGTRRDRANVREFMRLFGRRVG